MGSVLTEITTLTEAAQGTSIARFGHGELRVMSGKDARFQKHTPELEIELKAILADSPCLQCVPHTRGIRGWEWEVFLEQYGKHISKSRWYGSAFAFKEEYCAPDLHDYFASSDCIYVSPNRPPGPYRKWIPCIDRDSYDMADELLDTAKFSVCMGEEDITPIMLSCGPTGAVLADRLARKGLWAIDIGEGIKYL